MVLPLAKAPRGYLRLTYVGPVGDLATQSWDLTQFPPDIRADPSFKTSLLIFVKGSEGLTDVSGNVSFFPAVGTPTQLVLSFDAASISDQISLDVWCLHSIVGGVVDGPQLYFMGVGGGGGDVGAGLYTPVLTPVQNVASSSIGLVRYMRIENHVIVSGLLFMDAVTPFDNMALDMSLPIPTAFTDGASQLNGTASARFVNVVAATSMSVAAIYGTLDSAEFLTTPLDGSNTGYSFMFEYLVIEP